MPTWDWRCVGASQDFREAIISSAPQQRVLRSKRAVGEFEGSACVVIQTTDKARIDLKLDPTGT